MIMLSFDIEEFDVPKEKGANFSLQDGIEVSKIGTNNILDILKTTGVRATLFCTANFVTMAPDVIQRAISEGHEIACHGVDHWTPKADDPKTSKEIIEANTGLEMYGYRQPRMFDVSERLIKECGYEYNSSINPAFIPGKYMHLDIPRTPFMKEGVLQIPASVTPKFRVPLFWLSLHNFPMCTYLKLANSVLKHDGYFTTYFHPWEFVNHPKEIRRYMLPFVSYRCGDQMKSRLFKLIEFFKSKNQDFVTYKEFCDIKMKELND